MDSSIFEVKLIGYRTILNLTQHESTKEQIEAGVYEPDDKILVRQLLTFDTLPTKETIISQTVKLLSVVIGHQSRYVMIGGAPYQMSELEKMLRCCGIIPLYSFSERITETKIEEDGSVKKLTVFRHKGFIEV